MLWGIPGWTVFLLLTRINGLPQNTTMKGHSQHNPSLIGRKNQAKFENDCVLTNGHRIKITQSNLMILVSFSSAGVAWFEDVKRYGTFRSQATENPPFRFLWDTRYRLSLKSWKNSLQNLKLPTVGFHATILVRVMKVYGFTPPPPPSFRLGYWTDKYLSYPSFKKHYDHAFAVLKNSW